MAKTDDTIIAGLLRERDGYLRTGQVARAKLVAEQLKLRGYDVDDEEEGAKGKAEAPKGRTARPTRQTTAG